MRLEAVDHRVEKLYELAHMATTIALVGRDRVKVQSRYHHLPRQLT